MHARQNHIPGITDEMKTAVAALRQLFGDGRIRQEIDVGVVDRFSAKIAHPLVQCIGNAAESALHPNCTCLVVRTNHDHSLVSKDDKSVSENSAKRQYQPHGVRRQTNWRHPFRGYKRLSVAFRSCETIRLLY